MKVFDVVNGKAWHQYAEYATAEEASQHFAPTITFVDAPDEVFPGWNVSIVGGIVRFSRPDMQPGDIYISETGQVVDGEWYRSEERKALYAEYDGLESKYSARLLTDPTDTESAEKLAIIVQYKKDVGATVGQAGYPQTVTYPERPVL